MGATGESRVLFCVGARGEEEKLSLRGGESGRVEINSTWGRGAESRN